MPVFTSIGVALGAAAGSTAAFATGLAATAIVGAGVHAAGVSAGAAKASQAPSVVSADPRISEPAGDVTEAAAQTTSKKRAFRSGILFTSPTGLDNDSSVAGAKLV